MNKHVKNFSPSKTRAGKFYLKSPINTDSEDSSEDLNETIVPSISITDNILEDIITELNLGKKMDFKYEIFHVTIPNFDGDRGKLDSFIGKCDAFHASLKQEEKDIFFSNLIYKTEERAYEIYTTCVGKGYEEYRKALKKEIHGGRTADSLEREIDHLKQANLNVNEFANKISNLVSEIIKIIKMSEDSQEVKEYRIKILENRATRIFKEGLNEPLRTRVVASTVNENLQRTIEIAIQEEPFVKMNETFKVQRNYESRNYNSGRFNTNIRTNYKNNGNQYKYNVNSELPRTSQPNFTNQRYTLTCYKCGQQGHVSTNCRFKEEPKFCGRCKRSGHIKEVCHANYDVNGKKIESVKQTRILNNRNQYQNNNENQKNSNKDSLVGKSNPKFQLSNQM